MIGSHNKVEHRIVVLGSGGVGKSCLCIQFIQGHFVQAYDPTVEDSYRKQIDLDGSPHMIELLDTAGQDQFASMREQYMKSGDAFVLVYSIADPESFSAIQDIYEQLVRVKGCTPICILVGNKVDLKNERRIDYEDGKHLAEKWKVLFCETSALYRKTPHIESTPPHMHHMMGTEDFFMRILRTLILPMHASQMPIEAVTLGADASMEGSIDTRGFEEIRVGPSLVPTLAEGLPILSRKKKRSLCSIL